MQNILIAEDKESMAQMLKETLEGEGYKVVVARDGGEAVRFIKENKFDLVLTDLKLPKKDGIEVLKASKEEATLTPVLVMTAYGSVETAVSAMKEGAFDFISKPFDIDHLLMLIRRALENQRLKAENLLLKEEFSSRLGFPLIIGNSPKLVEVANKLQKVSQAKTTVLLLGESGTGKELFARAIHHMSPRKDYPFVPINCAAIPKGLLESELFGHEKSAFTGADSRKIGKFELADKGTIFLDEIGELELDLQAKLLRALQEGEIERIGQANPIKVDVRIISASNKNLEQEVAENRFREDLFYRLNVFPILIPPLRERKEDIPLLVDHFMKKFSTELNSEVISVSPETLDLMARYDWKGNVRELENTIERAIILCNGNTILPEHVSLNVTGGGFSLKTIPMDGPLEASSKAALRMVETERIKAALSRAGGNKSRAADELQVSYKTLLTKIKEYEIEKQQAG